jgi:hypothetical protein
LALKPAPLAAAPQPSNKDRVVALAKARLPTDPVQLVAKLAEPGFDFAAFQGLDLNARRTKVAQRVAQLAPAQSAFETSAASLGAYDFERLWVANLVALRIASGRVAALAALPAVEDLSEAGLSLPATGGPAYDGQDVQAGTRTMTLTAYGYSASQGNRFSAGTPVRIGVAEGQLGLNNRSDIHWNHAGLLHRYVFTWFGDNTDALAASQIDFDVRNRLQVSGSSIPIGCQYEIDVIAYNIPAGQSRTLWEAWLWHNEPPE